MPKPFYFGTPTFEWPAIITMILIALVSMVESTGVYFALSDITERKLTQKDLTRGYRAEGLAIMLGGVFNTFPIRLIPKTLDSFNFLVLKHVK